MFTAFFRGQASFKKLMADEADASSSEDEATGFGDQGESDDNNNDDDDDDDATGFDNMSVGSSASTPATTPQAKKARGGGVLSTMGLFLALSTCVFLQLVVVQPASAALPGFTPHTAMGEELYEAAARLGRLLGTRYGSSTSTMHSTYDTDSSSKLDLAEVAVMLVRVASRSVSPPWGRIRFRLSPRTYDPRGPSVRVVSQTK